MNFLLIDADSVAPQAWRNGGGQTRELLAWPAGAEWKLRISRADIESDGAFSAFPQVERWFAVLRGAGVVLAFADGDRELKAGDPPLRFDGGTAPGCRLLDGPTQDLNLMARNGVGVMRRVDAGRGWCIRGRVTGYKGSSSHERRRAAPKALAPPLGTGAQRRRGASMSPPG
uniref:HutD/Ves family protein n=1 Tax=Roseateles sp. TaxID=1971397 RepID=UPI00286A38B8